VKNYEPDQFTEIDVLRCLDSAGLRYKQGHRYILSQCPTHEDSHPSVQIYKDDWFVNCHAGCGRYHITKAFPELRPERASQQGGNYQKAPIRKAKPVTQAPKYKTFDLMEYWKSLPEIPADHYFKSIPIDVLNDEMRWRWDAEHQRYFIPYFSRSETSIPFAQWRNLQGDVRFNFWKDAKPTMYGTWNLDPSDSPLFLVEGTSDAAVMQHCAVPWIAVPSASQPELVKAMGAWCKENGISIIFAGDRDAAGEKVREALDEVMSYRVRQPREPYKDWGDMFEAEGFKSVQNWCWAELYPGEELPWPEIEPGYKKPEEKQGHGHSDDPVMDDLLERSRLGGDMWSGDQGLNDPPEEKTDVQKVLDVFPGAKVLEVVGEKEQTKTPTVPPPPF